MDNSSSTDASNNTRSELRHIREIVERLERQVSFVAEGQGVFLREYERRHTQLEAKTEAVHARLVAHEDADKPKWAEVDAVRVEIKLFRDILTAQQRQIDNLVLQAKIQVWLAVLVGGAFVSWIVSQILALIAQ